MSSASPAKNIIVMINKPVLTEPLRSGFPVNCEAVSPRSAALRNVNHLLRLIFTDELRLAGGNPANYACRMIL